MASISLGLHCASFLRESRASDARQHLAYAELHGRDSKPSERKASVATAVLAAIAAADAACCHTLGERSRSDDHRDAVNLVKQVAPGGADASNRLQRLLNLKDESQYGFGGMSGQKHDLAIRQAKALIGFAEQTLQR
jgi:hypothetical protein